MANYIQTTTVREDRWTKFMVLFMTGTCCSTIELHFQSTLNFLFLNFLYRLFILQGMVVLLYPHVYIKELLEAVVLQIKIFIMVLDLFTPH